jgi:hypothetical protein
MEDVPAFSVNVKEHAADHGESAAGQYAVRLNTREARPLRAIRGGVKVAADGAG